MRSNGTLSGNMSSAKEGTLHEALQSLRISMATTLELHYAADFDPKRITHSPKKTYGRMIWVGFSMGCMHHLGESVSFGENTPT